MGSKLNMNILKSFKDYKFFIKYTFILLLLFNISRYLLVYSSDIDLDYLFLIYSFRMDMIIISAVLLISIIFYTFNLILLSRIFLSIVFLLVFYLEVANYFFGLMKNLSARFITFSYN